MDSEASPPGVGLWPASPTPGSSLHLPEPPLSHRHHRDEEPLSIQDSDSGRQCPGHSMGSPDRAGLRDGNDGGGLSPSIISSVVSAALLSPSSSPSWFCLSLGAGLTFSYCTGAALGGNRRPGPRAALCLLFPT